MPQQMKAKFKELYGYTKQNPDLIFYMWPIPCINAVMRGWECHIMLVGIPLCDLQFCLAYVMRWVFRIT